MCDWGEIKEKISTQVLLDLQYKRINVPITRDAVEGINFNFIIGNEFLNSTNQKFSG